MIERLVAELRERLPRLTTTVGWDKYDNQDFLEISIFDDSTADDLRNLAAALIAAADAGEGTE